MPLSCNAPNEAAYMLRGYAYTKHQNLLVNGAGAGRCGTAGLAAFHQFLNNIICGASTQVS